VIQLLIDKPRSFVVICPWCGDCWARLVGREQPFFDHRYVPCEIHPEANFPYGVDLAGSLLEVDLELTLDDLPEELIKREFQLTMSNLPTELT
jgi:hypothetical protein